MHEQAALAQNPQTKKQTAARLKRIEGQIRGLQRMVEEDRYCPDILTQLASVHAALRGVGKLLMRNHLQHCVTGALRSGDAVEAERTYDEVTELMYRHMRE
ncbi:MAG TPA: metal-sensitive transcriptional regulator [Longimicrobiales bacterium]|nr:metal-sensitive transcriptional regulator [Longimicrobiales bacterium]